MFVCVYCVSIRLVVRPFVCADVNVGGGGGVCVCCVVVWLVVWV